MKFHKLKQFSWPSKIYMRTRSFVKISKCFIIFLKFYYVYSLIYQQESIIKIKNCRRIYIFCASWVIGPHAPARTSSCLTPGFVGKWKILFSSWNFRIKKKITPGKKLCYVTIWLDLYIRNSKLFLHFSTNHYHDKYKMTSWIKRVCPKTFFK